MAKFTRMANLNSNTRAVTAIILEKKHSAFSQFHQLEIDGNFVYLKVIFAARQSNSL